MKKRPFTEQEIEYLKENFVKYGGIYCAKQLERTPPYVFKKAYSLGLKRKDSNQWKLDKSPQQVSMEQFYNITDYRIAYILGFIWADGHVSKTKNLIIISTQSRDGKDIQQAVVGIIPFHIYIASRNKQSIFSIGDLSLHTFLVEHDYINKSTLSPTKILSKIPQHLKHYFFRGYFDGDGCFTNKTNRCISFTGHYEQDWTDVENFIKSLEITPQIIRRNDDKRGYKSSFIYVYGKDKCKKILEDLYKGEQVGLTRKSNLFHEFITNL